MAKMIPRIECEFVMPSCGHEAIFRKEYVRTNRTSQTKIMRCFPHCCPGHRDRSYCGSPLHVRIFSDSHQIYIDNRLVVYCRFRPVHLKSLSIGDCISIESVRASLQSGDPSKGQWIESRRLSLEPKSTTFEIDPNRGRWFYRWGGVATVAMRSTQHVFEAVVFYHIHDNQLEVVAQTSSPAFRLKSFRRSDTLSSNPQLGGANASADRLQSPTGDVQASVMQLSSRAPSAWAKTPDQGEAFDTARTLRSSLERSTAHPLVEAPGVVPVTPSSSTSNALGSIMRWLRELPASSAGSRLMLKWQDMVEEACAAQVKASREPVDLVPILSALESTFPSQSTWHPPAQQTESPLDTIDAAVGILLNEWLSVESIRASTRATDDFLRNGMVGNEAAHRTWLNDAVARAQRYVHVTSRTPWPQIMAMTSRIGDEHHQSPIAVDGGEFSFRAFVSRCRERLIHKSQQRRSSFPGHKHRRTETSGARLREYVPAGFRSSAHVWRCRIEDMAIEMNDKDRHALSLLTVVQFWKHLSCLRLDFSTTTGSAATPPQLSVASVFNSLVNDGNFTKLTLDGQYRWFNCLPSGEPTIGTTLMGYVLGDYVGRATSAGTIHVTTYLWPATAESSTAFAWHWTIDAASLSSGSSSSVVSVVVQCASVGRTPHAMETMSMAEKLRCVGPWQHACELRLVFRIR